MILKIAVVDDNAEDLRTEIDYLTRYFNKNHGDLVPSLKIEGFQDAKKFIVNFAAGTFDLIILDIIMGDINGIRVGQFIRECDKACNIMFVTTSEDFIMDGYSVFAVGYFIKPISEHEREFEKAFEYIKPKPIKELAITLPRSAKVKVPYDEICFVDINFQHKVRIVTPTQELITNMNYRDCQEILLEDKRFLECHHRIIINMDHVEAMKSEDFILKNGEKIPTSQRKRRESKLKYMNYLLHRSNR